MLGRLEVPGWEEARSPHTHKVVIGTKQNAATVLLLEPLKCGGHGGRVDPHQVLSCKLHATHAL
jgi:hypothetical protein